MFYFADQPTGQIADSTNAAKSSLHKARRRLRDYITEHRPDLIPVSSRRTPMVTVRIAHAGPGLGVIHGWRIEQGRSSAEADRPAADSFHRQGRDLYIATGDTGFWHAAVRAEDHPDRELLMLMIKERARITVDLLFGDSEGGQRTRQLREISPLH